MIRSLIPFAAHPSVQPRWDGRFRPRDQSSVATSSGANSRANGAESRLSVRAAYAIVIVLIAISDIVNTFSFARDISWRLGVPHNLWEPALWQFTSNIVIVALLPLGRRGGVLVRVGTNRLLLVASGLTALLLAFSTLHIAGMGLLRELAYGLAGWTYSFPWRREIPYEFPKDLFAYAAFVVIFWLAERPAPAAAKAAEEGVPVVRNDRPAAAEIWLRDGRTSILIDPNEITSVTSAGNYVEFRSTGRRSHLIRTTLQAQEQRLEPFGIVRVHRSRLINLKRVVALERRAAGDFELRLDTGEIVAGSRRFKSAVADITTG
jgi:LytTr DNA-binding domain-containing protein